MRLLKKKISFLFFIDRLANLKRPTILSTRHLVRYSKLVNSSVGDRAFLKNISSIPLCKEMKGSAAYELKKFCPKAKEQGQEGVGPGKSNKDRKSLLLPPMEAFLSGGRKGLPFLLSKEEMQVRKVKQIINYPIGAANVVSSQEQNIALQTFWNYTFDKGRLKNYVSWFLHNFGEFKTLSLIQELKSIGFEYATRAGISLGIDDLKVPFKKAELLDESESYIKIGMTQYHRGEITGVERFQRLIETWHRTSEILKQEVINYFEKTDILNPVYMMAFSGARGNISQVRQLVGMRGLMADPQGQLIEFPIRSNFREGLTLTEYIISSYGARKGTVDTALRTANAGYLTRRLVDVAQHVIISNFDCGTKRGIYLNDMKEGKKIVYSLQNRLIGRVLGKNVYRPSEGQVVSVTVEPLGKMGKEEENRQIKKIILAKRNKQIDPFLASELSQLENNIFVRSPLTCETKELICQLCYGWSLAQGNLVSIGETVGVIAGQSIGEPGTQLTMRTFHTGGVFSGDISDQIKAPFNGFVYYFSLIPGSLIRNPNGQICFLTKGSGQLVFLKTRLHFGLRSFSNSSFFPFPKSLRSKHGVATPLPFATGVVRSKQKRGGVKSSKEMGAYFFPCPKEGTRQKKEEIRKINIPSYTILFKRNGEKIFQKEVIAQISENLTQQNIREEAQFTIRSEVEGEFYLGTVDFTEKFIGPKLDKQEKKILEIGKHVDFPKFINRRDQFVEASNWGYAWILAGKICPLPFSSYLFPKVGDLISKKANFIQIKWAIPSVQGLQFCSPTFLFSSLFAFRTKDRASITSQYSNSLLNASSHPLLPLSLTPPVLRKSYGDPPYFVRAKEGKSFTSQIKEEAVQPWQLAEPFYGINKSIPKYFAKGFKDMYKEKILFLNKKKTIQQNIFQIDLTNISYKQIGYFLSFYLEDTFYKTKNLKNKTLTFFNKESLFPSFYIQKNKKGSMNNKELSSFRFTSEEPFLVTRRKSIHENLFKQKIDYLLRDKKDIFFIPIGISSVHFVFEDKTEKALGYNRKESVFNKFTKNFLKAPQFSNKKATKQDFYLYGKFNPLKKVENGEFKYSINYTIKENKESRNISLKENLEERRTQLTDKTEKDSLLSIQGNVSEKNNSDFPLRKKGFATLKATEVLRNNVKNPFALSQVIKPSTAAPEDKSKKVANNFNKQIKKISVLNKHKEKELFNFYLPSKFLNNSNKSLSHLLRKPFFITPSTYSVSTYSVPTYFVPVRRKGQNDKTFPIVANQSQKKTGFFALPPLGDVNLKGEVFAKNFFPLSKVDSSFIKKKKWLLSWKENKIGVNFFENLYCQKKKIKLLIKSQMIFNLSNNLKTFLFFEKGTHISEPVKPPKDFLSEEKWRLTQKSLFGQQSRVQDPFLALQSKHKKSITAAFLHSFEKFDLLRIPVKKGAYEVNKGIGDNSVLTKKKEKYNFFSKIVWKQKFTKKKKDKSLPSHRRGSITKNNNVLCCLSTHFSFSFLHYKAKHFQQYKFLKILEHFNPFFCLIPKSILHNFLGPWAASLYNVKNGPELRYEVSRSPSLLRKGSENIIQKKQLEKNSSELFIYGYLKKKNLSFLELNQFKIFPNKFNPSPLGSAKAKNHYFLKKNFMNFYFKNNSLVKTFIKLKEKKSNKLYYLSFRNISKHWKKIEKLSSLQSLRQKRFLPFKKVKEETSLSSKCFINLQGRGHFRNETMTKTDFLIKIIKNSVFSYRNKQFRKKSKGFGSQKLTKTPVNKAKTRKKMSSSLLFELQVLSSFGGRGGKANTERKAPTELMEQQSKGIKIGRNIEKGIKQKKAEDQKGKQSRQTKNLNSLKFLTRKSIKEKEIFFFKNEEISLITKHTSKKYNSYSYNLSAKEGKVKFDSSASRSIKKSLIQALVSENKITSDFSSVNKVEEGLNFTNISKFLFEKNKILFSQHIGPKRRLNPTPLPRRVVSLQQSSSEATPLHGKKVLRSPDLHLLRKAKGVYAVSSAFTTEGSKSRKVLLLHRAVDSKEQRVRKKARFSPTSNIINLEYWKKLIQEKENSKVKNVLFLKSHYKSMKNYFRSKVYSLFSNNSQSQQEKINPLVLRRKIYENHSFDLQTKPDFFIAETYSIFNNKIFYSENENRRLYKRQKKASHTFTRTPISLGVDGSGAPKGPAKLPLWALRSKYDGTIRTKNFNTGSFVPDVSNPVSLLKKKAAIRINNFSYLEKPILFSPYKFLFNLGVVEGNLFGQKKKQRNQFIWKIYTKFYNFNVTNFNNFTILYKISTTPSFEEKNKDQMRSEGRRDLSKVSKYLSYFLISSEGWFYKNIKPSKILIHKQPQIGPCSILEKVYNKSKKINTKKHLLKKFSKNDLLFDSTNILISHLKFSFPFFLFYKKKNKSKNVGLRTSVSLEKVFSSLGGKALPPRKSKKEEKTSLLRKCSEAAPSLWSFGARDGKEASLIHKVGGVTSSGRKRQKESEDKATSNSYRPLSGTTSISMETFKSQKGKISHMKSPIKVIINKQTSPRLLTVSAKKENKNSKVLATLRSKKGVVRSKQKRGGGKTLGIFLKKQPIIKNQKKIKEYKKKLITNKISVLPLPFEKPIQLLLTRKNSGGVDKNKYFWIQNKKVRFKPLYLVDPLHSKNSFVALQNCKNKKSIIPFFSEKPTEHRKVGKTQTALLAVRSKSADSIRRGVLGKERRKKKKNSFFLIKKLHQYKSLENKVLFYKTKFLKKHNNSNFYSFLAKNYGEKLNLSSFFYDLKIFTSTLRILSQNSLSNEISNFSYNLKFCTNSAFFIPGEKADKVSPTLKNTLSRTAVSGRGPFRVSFTKRNTSNERNRFYEVRSQSLSLKKAYTQNFYLNRQNIILCTFSKKSFIGVDWNFSHYSNFSFWMNFLEQIQTNKIYINKGIFVEQFKAFMSLPNTLYSNTNFFYFFNSSNTFYPSKSFLNNKINIKNFLTNYTKRLETLENKSSSFLSITKRIPSLPYLVKKEPFGSEAIRRKGHTLLRGAAKSKDKEQRFYAPSLLRTSVRNTLLGSSVLYSSKVKKEGSAKKETKNSLEIFKIFFKQIFEQPAFGYNLLKNFKTYNIESKKSLTTNEKVKENKFFTLANQKISNQDFVSKTRFFSPLIANIGPDGSRKGEGEIIVISSLNLFKRNLLFSELAEKFELKKLYEKYLKKKTNKRIKFRVKIYKKSRKIKINPSLAYEGSRGRNEKSVTSKNLYFTKLAEPSIGFFALRTSRGRKRDKAKKGVLGEKEKLLKKILKTESLKTSCLVLTKKDCVSFQICSPNFSSVTSDNSLQNKTKITTFLNTKPFFPSLIKLTSKSVNSSPCSATPPILLRNRKKDSKAMERDKSTKIKGLNRMLQHKIHNLKPPSVTRLNIGDFVLTGQYLFSNNNKIFKTNKKDNNSFVKKAFNHSGQLIHFGFETSLTKVEGILKINRILSDCGEEEVSSPNDSFKKASSFFALPLFCLLRTPSDRERAYVVSRERAYDTQYPLLTSLGKGQGLILEKISGNFGNLSTKDIPHKIIEKRKIEQKIEKGVIKNFNIFSFFHLSKLTNKNWIFTVRKAQSIYISKKTIFHSSHGDFIQKRVPIITLAYETLKTGDIVQGIPKVEQFFEARTTKKGRLFLENLPNLLTGLYLYYTKHLKKASDIFLSPRPGPQGPARQSKGFLNNKEGVGQGLRKVYSHKTLLLQNKSSKQKNDKKKAFISSERDEHRLHPKSPFGEVRKKTGQEKNNDFVSFGGQTKKAMPSKNHSQTTENGMEKNFENNSFGGMLILPTNKELVRQAFYKIQQIIIDGVQRVYQGQGVTIAEKHLEIVVKQMTCRVRIINGGETGFFPGEIVHIDFIEYVNNLSIKKKAYYKPQVLGITRSSLQVDSFISAASFQQTTKILSAAALSKKKDFLKGLKENVILGNLLPAGTGYFNKFLSI